MSPHGREACRFPQLPRAVAAELAHQVSTLPVSEAADRSDVRHPSMIYSATGPPKISDSRLRDFRSKVIEIAARLGYPGQRGQPEMAAFDSAMLRLVDEYVRLTPAEASLTGVWSFLGCVLLPDTARWRFFSTRDTGTSVDRIDGSKTARGARNIVGRLWWRLHLLREEDGQDPYRLIDALNEDQLVAIVERPVVAGIEGLARVWARVFLEYVDAGGHPEYHREEVMRNMAKRLRRKVPVISFAALDAEAQATHVKSTLAETLEGLQRKAQWEMQRQT